MARAAIYLNDPERDYFSDEILVPYLQIALDDLRGELYDNSIPLTNTRSTELQVTTAMTDIGGPTGPALPEALVEIQGLYERTYGTSESFMEMNKVEFLPFTSVLSNSLVDWAWQEQQIKFNGALSIRGVKINYIEDTLARIINKDSVIEMIHSMPFLAYRTAALAADFGGEDGERAIKLNSAAGYELEKLMNISIKGSQVISVRRRPFMAGRRGRH